jgi:hypothetical protein
MLHASSNSVKPVKRGAQMTQKEWDDDIRVAFESALRDGMKRSALVMLLWRLGVRRYVDKR